MIGMAAQGVWWYGNYRLLYLFSDCNGLIGVKIIVASKTIMFTLNYPSTLKDV